MEKNNWKDYYLKGITSRFARLKNWCHNRWLAILAWFKKQSRWKLALLGIVLPVLLGVFSVLFLALMVRQGVFGPLPTYAELENIRNYQASEVYGVEDALLGRYYIENRVNADLEELPADLINGLVATEDARFFEHNGVDLRAYARVLVKSIILGNESAGGGSTISQQLGKNLFPRQRHRFLEMPINKMREMYIARRLEKTYGKEDILRLYLNTVPFGENAFGIKIAAQRFFNKSASQLNTEEAAVLIGMLKANTRYNPMRNPEAAVNRRNIVLSQMHRYGYLDSLQLDTLSSMPLEIDYRAESNNLGLATYFREHLRHEIQDILKDYPKSNGKPYNIYTDGLKIYTTIDARLQSYAEAAVQDYLPELQKQFAKDWGDRAPWGKEEVLQKYVERSPSYRALKKRGLSQVDIDTVMARPVQMTVFDWEEGIASKEMSPLDSVKLYLTLLNTGLLSAEPHTGLIRAWVGGNNHRFIQYDHVKAQRQVGSTIKPVVYAAALQNGMLPCEYTENVRRKYNQFKGWEPRNSDGKYEGAYSMEGALSRSVNTVTVETALRAGIDTVQMLAKQMGISAEIPLEPAISLGAVDASLLDMVMVYSVFANRGKKPSRLHYLDRIETAQGDTIVAFERPNPKEFPRVLGLNEVDMITHMLQAVVDSGTARRLRYEFKLWGDVAGKTGTTQNQSDGWFMGFTPKLVTGVWVGAETPEIHFRRTRVGQGSNSALPIWGRYMRDIWTNKEYRWVRSRFPEPADTTAAYLKCPPYLESLPIYIENWWEIAPEALEAFNREIQELSAEELDHYLQELKRRDNESLEEYGERIRRRVERDDRRDQRREKRKKFWGKLLFGKDDDG